MVLKSGPSIPNEHIGVENMVLRRSDVGPLEVGMSSRSPRSMLIAGDRTRKVREICDSGDNVGGEPLLTNVDLEAWKTLSKIYPIMIASSLNKNQSRRFFTVSAPSCKVHSQRVQPELRIIIQILSASIVLVSYIRNDVSRTKTWEAFFICAKAICFAFPGSIRQQMVSHHSKFIPSAT